MELASHNSWSFLKPRRWWMRPFAFTAQCQDADIRTQYLRYGVRCFDLRVSFEGMHPVVVHNLMEYDISEEGLYEDLGWLNAPGDVAIRVLLDIRSKKKCTSEKRGAFVDFCYDLEKKYPRIKFWCGRNLCDWKVLYKFKHSPTCKEKYSSVCSPKWIDDWWPRLFAWRKNKEIRREGTSCDYLMIDFVNYGEEAS